MAAFAFVGILLNPSSQPMGKLSVAQPTFSVRYDSPTIIPPEPQREFRGAWIATVVNVDWPSQPGLPSEQQQAELIAMLDRAVELKLNSVIFQVRPASDALYPSKYEPWSESLTGEMGKAPDPYYDPLAFAVDEAHKRGLELHAWFNPYRAYHAQAKSPISVNHISKTNPELVKQYGKYLWLDPGEKAVQNHSLAVIIDVVQRYDIDGVHLDDYFYPYNQGVDFPDNTSWEKYLRSGGTLNRSDWRRDNINTFVETLYRSLKAEKPWVKFGISPFGIWQPGYPPQIKGYNAYERLYADARKWLENGWLDYFAPQLYWKIDQTAQSYPVLLSWWVEQNTKNRHIWPGNFTSQVGNKSSKAWSANEIISQIQATRQQEEATGNIHFSMKTLMQNRAGISTALQEVYKVPALVPASPWLNNKAPGKPFLLTYKDGEKVKLTWRLTDKEPVWLWLVQKKAGNEWITEILPGNQMLYPVDGEAIAVSAINRYGIQGKPAIVEIQDREETTKALKY